MNCLTVRDFLTFSAKNFPKKKAIIADDYSWTYQELDKISSSIASYIVSNTNKKDIVGMFFDNSAAFVATYFGIVKSKRAALILNPNAPKDQIIYQVKKTNPKLVITDEKFKFKLDQLDKLSGLVILFDQTVAHNRIVQLPVIDEEDVLSIIFTSGTTSDPKGVVLKHKNVVAATKNMSTYLGIDENDKCLIFLPLYHSFGLGNIHMHVLNGGTCILVKNAINLNEIFNRLEKEKISNFSAVPATLTLIANNFLPKLKKLDGKVKFIITNSTFVPENTATVFINTLKETKFYTYYGLTEASRSTFLCFNRNPEKKLSVGRPLPNVSLKIVNEQGKDLPVMGTGEVVIKGKHVIDEYYKNKTASKIIKDGWFHTADMGYVDQDGFLFLLGRKDEMLNISGEKVSPLEIEKVIKQTGLVQDVAVVGLPHPVYGNIVGAGVIPADNYDEEKLITYCRLKLDRYKVPQRILTVKDFPKTESGKLKKNEIKEMFK